MKIDANRFVYPLEISADQSQLLVRAVKLLLEEDTDLCMLSEDERKTLQKLQVRLDNLSPARNNNLIEFTEEDNHEPRKPIID